MQFDAILFDHCILRSSMTRFTEDIPATFNKHFYYMDPSKSSGKLCMHIPAGWGSWTVRVPFKAWAAFIFSVLPNIPLPNYEWGMSAL